jgi:hypothetical protein
MEYNGFPGYMSKESSPHFTFLDGKLPVLFIKLVQLGEIRLTYRFDPPING